MRHYPERCDVIRRYTIGHLFAGLGGGALGAASASARVGRHRAEFKTVGGVDLDAGAARDFERIVGAPCAVADVHGMQPAELRAAWGARAPDMVLSSPPCRSYSALLPASRASEPEYRRMGELAIVGVNLVLSTWDPPPRILFIENVPRIRTRGRDMLIALRQVLDAHGYAMAEGVHDCGVVGGLAQHRRRWFMVARHRAFLPRVVYQPPKRRVRACGEVLERLPLPLFGQGGPMHAMPAISSMSWVRLALIQAGGDWRDLPSPDGISLNLKSGYANVYHVIRWDRPSKTIAGATRPGSGAPGVADPRLRFHAGVYGVRRWSDASCTVTAGAMPSRGAFSVADPRLGCAPRTGVYGVIDWMEPARTIGAHHRIDNSPAAVADPRIVELLGEDPRRAPDVAPIILSADGCWHRPLTTLELAALQGFPARAGDGWLELDGRSTTAWRKRIGNAIPPPAAEAIGSQMLRAMLGADAGALDELALDPVWVRPHDHGAVAA